jgi:hypothetical protein
MAKRRAQTQGQLSSRTTQREAAVISQQAIKKQSNKAANKGLASKLESNNKHDPTPPHHATTRPHTHALFSLFSAMVNLAHQPEMTDFLPTAVGCQVFGSNQP